MKDKEISRLLGLEKARQKKVINLIASENYVSSDVRFTLASEFVNKYAEGYPGKRYYGGNEYVDELETLCMNRARSVFGLSESEWGVNVQALSGSPANVAVYTALVPYREKIMGLSLDHGGHLTHGHAVSVTGKWWKQIPFFVDLVTERLHYEAIRQIALKEKPALIVVGFTAYSRVVDWKKIREIATEVGALMHVDMSHLAGLVAGGVYPSPFAYADTVMTTTHKTLRGPRSALIFSRKDERKLNEKIDKAVFPGLQGGPHINQIAAVAVALQEALEPFFKSYAKQVIRNAEILAKELSSLGWRIVSGGTDSHLFLLDTWREGKGISGGEASDVLEKAGIIVNKNTIPGDTRSPKDPSGIRIGAAAETTRGKKEKDMKIIARKIDEALKKAMASKNA
ncbi:MAG: serine hydroxymethyltransferase [Candidatus Zambryskibacteria bacterium]|nr:serine hydroxymethyltransferase [Candidatus Zambryskibacteria bacterium]